MAINLEQVTDALGSHLLGSISHLGSQGTVWLSDDETTLNAGFSKQTSGYGIMMLNPGVEPEPIMGRLRRQLFEVELRLLRKKGGSLMTRLRGSGTDKGIYEFAADVETVLLHNRLGTLLDPFPGVSVDGFEFDDSQADVVVARTIFRGRLTG